MSTIQLFRNYIKDYHPQLVQKDWKLEKRSLSIKETTVGSEKKEIPETINQELIYWVFFYDTDASEVVYMIQNNKNLQFISIMMFSKGKLIKPISLM